MPYDVAGLGNALMDALIVVDHADAVLSKMGLVRGTMHLVDHASWQEAFDALREHGVVLESGGSCANTIATMGRLGSQAIYCGQTGDDELGRVYAERMTEACGGHALRVAAGEPTGKCLSIVAREDAERTMLTDLGAAVAMPDLGPFEAVLDEARLAHFTGYTLLEGPMRGVTLEAMRRAKAAGAEISLDVADPFVVPAIRDLLWDVLDRYVDVVFLNAEEARALTEQSPEHAVDTVAEQANVDTVVVKLGARGSLVRRAGEVHRIEARLVPAVDTTGAGDAYAGGFLHGRLLGWTPDRCGALGSAVAARTVSQLGAVVRDTEALRRLVSDLTP